MSEVLELTEVTETATTESTTRAQEVEARLQSLIDTSVASMPDDTIESQPFVLYPNYVELKLGKLSKNISLLDFKGILDTLLQAETKLVMNALPYNCFVFAKSNTEMRLSCYHPEKMMEITHAYDGYSTVTDKYTIPFPNTIITFKLGLDSGLWKIQDVKYFCTNKKVTQLPEDTIITEPNYAEGIWTMPFPNYYGDGRMCYGRNTMPTTFTNNLRGLDYYYQVIFGSPFNNDLGIGSTEQRIDPKNWFKKLSKLTEFPYDELKKSGHRY